MRIIIFFITCISAGYLQGGFLTGENLIRMSGSSRFIEVSDRKMCDDICGYIKGTTQGKCLYINRTCAIPRHLIQNLGNHGSWLQVETEKHCSSLCAIFSSDNCSHSNFCSLSGQKLHGYCQLIVEHSHHVKEFGLQCKTQENFVHKTRHTRQVRCQGRRRFSRFGRC